MWLGAMYEYAGIGKPAVSIEILQKQQWKYFRLDIFLKVLSFLEFCIKFSYRIFGSSDFLFHFRLLRIPFMCCKYLISFNNKSFNFTHKREAKFIEKFPFRLNRWVRRKKVKIIKSSFLFPLNMNLFIRVSVSVHVKSPEFLILPHSITIFLYKAMDVSNIVWECIMITDGNEQSW